MTFLKIYEKIFQHILVSSETRFSSSDTKLQLFTKQGCMSDRAKSSGAI